MELYILLHGGDLDMLLPFTLTGHNNGSLMMVMIVIPRHHQLLVMMVQYTLAVISKKYMRLLPTALKNGDI